MNPILLSPKIESEKSTAEQLQQMKSYLFQFKEQMELLLMNIDSDNMSKSYKEEMSRQFADSKSMSEILQTAGMIKMSVKDVSNTVSSLAVTVGGIYAEVHGADGILARLAVTESGVSASVKKGVQYSGISLSASGVQINSSGTFTVDTTNFTLNASGDMWCQNGTFSGHVEASSGKLGNLLIDNGWLSYKPGNTKYPVISYDSVSQAVLFGSDSFSTQIRGFDLSIDCGSNHLILGSSLSPTLRIYGGYGIEIDGEITYNDGQENLNMYWQKLSDVDPDDYVITNKAG